MEDFKRQVRDYIRRAVPANVYCIEDAVALVVTHFEELYPKFNVAEVLSLRRTSLGYEPVLIKDLKPQAKAWDKKKQPVNNTFMRMLSEV